MEKQKTSKTQQSKNKARSKTNPGKQEKKQEKKQEQTEKNQQNQNQNIEEEITFQPRSSVIQNFKNETNKLFQDKASFETILTNKKIQGNMSLSADKPKRGFKINQKSKIKVESQSLIKAKEIMENPHLKSHKQSEEIEQEEIDFLDLKKKNFNALKPQAKKGPFVREKQINTIIDAAVNLDDQDVSEQEEYNKEIDYDLFQEEKLDLFEPNMVPFKNKEQLDEQILMQKLKSGQNEEKSKEKYQELKEKLEEERKKEQQKDFFEVLEEEDYAILQFPSKFLYQLPQNFNRRNRISLGNPENYGDNREILNLNVQRTYDSAGNQITSYYGDINHYLENYQKLDFSSQNIGYKLGKFVQKKNGEIKFQSGENQLEIQKGIPNNCQQELTLIDTNKNQCTKLGNLNNKFVLRPNIEEMYELQQQNIGKIDFEQNELIQEDN
ncbi:hypothetical protein PPERSA_07588 [Pseudocohnilembus persalinus]|uniref:Uncharacterized protein n=1 Tax=Pseudocohnilembus persalinus TaxID=266149 RepID=A0A0V0QIF5_PSEPJ|nr:hypothetical protein PPERSA_07588 [Pseudocohnilembus persalinus]|eukprot:KRX01943.1 hypothetical protein PPERSA_07588 [Pseudocohnilembus persalinus]